VAVTVCFFLHYICSSSYFLHAYEGINGCTIVTASALEGHSSVKVWGQHTQVSIPPFSSSTLMLLLENRLACPCGPNFTHGRYHDSDDLLRSYLYICEPCHEVPSPVPA
jgi:hypothetical protein